MSLLTKEVNIIHNVKSETIGKVARICQPTTVEWSSNVGLTPG